MADRFPEIEGTSLSLVEHRLPGTLAGEVNLLLIAFRQWYWRTSTADSERTNFR